MPRAEKKFHFIYKTTNLLSGKYYIGMHSTDDLNDGYMGSGKRLRYSLNKYGKENHKVEILEYFDSREELGKREREVVCLDEIAKDECMNLVVGGEGFAMDRVLMANEALQYKLKHDEVFRREQGEKISKGVKLAYAEGRILPHGGGWNKDISLTEIHKARIGQANSVKQKGELNSNFGKCWVTKDGINKNIDKADLILYFESGWSKGKCLLPFELVKEMKTFYAEGNSYQKVSEKFGLPKGTILRYIRDL